ncbi:hypothetical protein V6N13_050480 [Hibiscus sabdariffa]
MVHGISKTSHWYFKGISYMYSALGTPLRERLEFAKVCIEVDTAFRVENSTALISDGHVAPVHDSVDNLSSSQDIPSCASLQDSTKKTGRDRLDTGKDIVGSINKFVVLSDGDVTAP